MQYPGHIVKLGEPDSRIVKALKAQLNRMLAVQRIAALKLKLDDPNFGPKMKQALQLFQARSVDGDGGLMTTIEGNTDASKSREGGGVYRLRRKIVEANKGFVDYAGV